MIILFMVYFIELLLRMLERDFMVLVELHFHLLDGV